MKKSSRNSANRRAKTWSSPDANHPMFESAKFSCIKPFYWWASKNPKIIVLSRRPHVTCGCCNPNVQPSFSLEISKLRGLITVDIWWNGGVWILFNDSNFPHIVIVVIVIVIVIAIVVAHPRWLFFLFLLWGISLRVRVTSCSLSHDINKCPHEQGVGFWEPFRY